MEAMGGSPTTQELDAVMYELDSNGDSVVDFPEFLTKFLTATDEKELLSVFHQLAIQEGESNDDRVLTLTAVERSFQYVGERLTDEDKKYLEIIFLGADKDGNGRLDIKEFTAYLEKMDDELFMGQAGALGNLLAAANASGAGVNGGQRGNRSGGGGGGGLGASQRRSGGEEGELGGDGGAGFSGTADVEAGAAMLTNAQLLAMATRASSSRGGGGGGFPFGGGGGGGFQDDVESVSSNQGGMRNSFLSRLTRVGRHRRSSVNSSTIAALAGQLASLGVTGGMAPRVDARLGSMGSAACMMGAGLLQPEASEGLRSVSSARTALHSHIGGPAAPPPAPPGGVAAHFLVESSSMSTLRPMSSTGHIPGCMFLEEQSLQLVGAAATAPVALSRGGSFGDSAGQGAGGQEGEQAARPGPSYQYPGWTSGSAAAAAAGGWHTPPLPSSTAPNQQQQQPPRPPVFRQMRSRSMPSAVAPATVASPPMGLTPLVIPASLRDPDEFLSGSTSPFSPAPGSSVAAASQERGGGGIGVSPASQERGGGGGGGVHAGYSGRTPGSGLRSPAASWQKASVIEEAPEEGDLGYGGMGASVSVQVPAALLGGQRLDLHGGRTSAPTRFARLASCPARTPLKPDPTAGGGGGGGGGGGEDGGGEDGAGTGGGASGISDGRSSTGGGGGGPGWPRRLGSGGDGRFSSRIGGLMAAVFSRPRSLGHGAAAVGAAAAAAVQDAEIDPEATEPGTRPSPLRAHLPMPPPSAGRLSGGGSERRPLEAAEVAAAAATPSISWGFVASARAAMGWLRRAGSFGQNNQTAAGGGGGTPGVGDAEDVAHDHTPPPPFPAAVGAGRVPPRRLTVQVPGVDSPASSKPTSPADFEASPGPTSASTSHLLSPCTAYFPSPFSSPAAAAAAAAIAGVLTSPPPALLAGSAALGGASAGQETGPPAPGSGGRVAAASSAAGRPSPSAPWAANLATSPPPYLWPTGSPQSRSSVPGGQAHLPHQQQQHQQLSSLGLQPPGPPAAALPPPARPPPPPRPAPQVPSGMSTSLRVGGAALGAAGGGARILNRSGSVGGSSRLAVSSARDSPPMQRQQSLQSLQQQHQQQQQQNNPHPHPHHPPAPPPHRLSQQGLPQGPPHLHWLGPHPNPHPNPHLDPQRWLLQSPNEPDQPLLPPQPQPHRLSHTGLPHGAPHYYPPAPPPQPQRRSGDCGGLASPPGPHNPHYYQARSGPGSAASSVGGPGSSGGPSTPRALASAAAAAAAAVAAVPVPPGSPWGVVSAAAFGMQPGGGQSAGAGVDGGAAGEALLRQAGWHGGVQAALQGGYPPPRPQQKPALMPGQRSDRVLGGVPPFAHYHRQQQPQSPQQQQQPQRQEGPQRQQPQPHDQQNQRQQTAQNQEALAAGRQRQGQQQPGQQLRTRTLGGDREPGPTAVPTLVPSGDT